MKSDFPYKSVHQFLDEVFKSIDEPTSKQIKEQKKIYWRMYNSALKVRRRRLLKYIALSINRSDFSELQRQAFAVDETVYDLMKERILNSDRPMLPIKLICRIHQTVFELLDESSNLESQSMQQKLTELEDMVHHLRSLL